MVCNYFEFSFMLNFKFIVDIIFFFYLIFFIVVLFEFCNIRKILDKECVMMFFD